MITARHAYAATETTHHGGDAFVIGRDQKAGQILGL
jgi:hypothetical protein